MGFAPSDEQQEGRSEDVARSQLQTENESSSPWPRLATGSIAETNSRAMPYDCILRRPMVDGSRNPSLLPKGRVRQHGAANEASAGDSNMQRRNLRDLQERRLDGSSLVR